MAKPSMTRRTRIGHARTDQNNVTLYDGANRITAGRCAGRRLRAYAKTSECVGVDVPTSGTLSIAPNRPCVSPSMPSVK
jgi:hypothetical protein